jgi:hypothetical protein
MGLDNAVMAESTDDPGEAMQWLDKAVFCFGQIDDAALLKKARMHRLSASFRAKLEKCRDSDSGVGDDIDQIEIEAAKIVGGILAEHLLVEARRLCSDMHPLSSKDSQRLLEERLISKMSRIAVE